VKEVASEHAVELLQTALNQKANNSTTPLIGLSTLNKIANVHVGLFDG